MIRIEWTMPDGSEPVTYAARASTDAETRATYARNIAARARGEGGVVLCEGAVGITAYDGDDEVPIDLDEVRNVAASFID